MSRLIKFRGKRVDNDEWFKGDLVDSKYIIGYFEVRELNTEEDLMNCAGIVREVIPETVGQFTGLSDKNGKDSYKDDVALLGGTKTKIVWSEKLAQWRLEPFPGQKKFGQEFSKEGWDLDRPFEVIGNIHENKELLETKDAGL